MKVLLVICLLLGFGGDLHAGLKDNPCLSDSIRKKIRPHRMKSSHPLKNEMDAIFNAHRATLDKEALVAAGFSILCIQPRSYICVAKHPMLKGYLLKLAFDSTSKTKRGHPFWEWFIRRCENAKIIKKVIKTNRFKHFTVPGKWIYCLPEEPSPPLLPEYTRKLSVLVVTDMNLVSVEENLEFWKNNVTEQLLDELFVIAKLSKKITLRPDNIWLTKEGKCAFIDTEYSNRKPNLHRIGEYLSNEMKQYWENLIKSGVLKWY